jgi:hypothetical protein
MAGVAVELTRPSDRIVTDEGEGLPGGSLATSTRNPAAATWRFLRPSAQKKTLLFQATLLLTAISLGVHALSFARLRGLLARCAGARGARDGALERDMLDAIVWAVETASRQIPSIGTYLTQALAVHVLLARRGVQSDLRIGLTRGPVQRESSSRLRGSRRTTVFSSGKPITAAITRCPC